MRSHPAFTRTRLGRFARFILIFLLMTTAATAPAEDSARPNIILFMSDDLGWGDLGCYGHEIIQTPNLDKFAEQGVLLTDCHAASAVCSPSRAAMLTGRVPQRNGVYTIVTERNEVPYLRESELTLPEILREQGYATCHVGKWHLGGVGSQFDEPGPSDHGYDHWLATPSNAKPSHLNPANFYRNGEATGVIEGNAADIIVTESMKWVSEIKDPEKPFFLTVWTQEPHTPIGTAPQFLEPYQNRENISAHDAEYYGNVTQIDAAFGKLMEFLDQEGLAENTFVLFTSDNGPAWDTESLDRVRASAGYHRGSKAWMYEGGLRVPGLIRWPEQVPPGAVSHAPVNGTDYFPTILEMLDLPLPEDRAIDGQSLMPVLRGEDLPERTLYWRYDGCDAPLKICYREGDWVLVTDAKIDLCELYNLSEDWQQRNNLVYEEFDRFAEMKLRLVELHEAIEEDGPDWWKDNPDPLIPWIRRNPEAITRHLLGKIPEEKPRPYPEAHWPEEGE